MGWLTQLVNHERAVGWVDVCEAGAAVSESELSSMAQPGSPHAPNQPLNITSRFLPCEVIGAKRWTERIVILRSQGS